MKEGGRIAGTSLSKVLKSIEVGMTTLEIDRIAEEQIGLLGGKPSFKGFEGYKYATCININNGVVHGVPKSSTKINEGDVVKVDLGVYYKGFNTDTAATIVVGQDKDLAQKSKFVDVGRKTLFQAIDACHVGGRIGDISSAIQRSIEGAGYSVVEELVGHGVGKSLHEDPQVPGLGTAGSGPLIKEGMALAIEVIYTTRKSQLVLESDDWTLTASNATIAGLFEHTVSLSNNGVEILTLV